MKNLQGHADWIVVRKLTNRSAYKSTFTVCLEHSETKWHNMNIARCISQCSTSFSKIIEKLSTQKLYTHILKIKMDYTRGKIMTTNHHETW